MDVFLDEKPPVNRSNRALSSVTFGDPPKNQRFWLIYTRFALFGATFDQIVTFFTELSLILQNCHLFSTNSSELQLLTLSRAFWSCQLVLGVTFNIFKRTHRYNYNFSKERHHSRAVSSSERNFLTSLKERIVKRRTSLKSCQLI